MLFTKAFDFAAANMQIVIQSLESGERKVLVKGGAVGRYLPTGHIVYVLTNNNINNLFAVPFDLDKLEVKGGYVSVLEGVSSYAFSDSGTLVYVPQPAAAAGAASTGTPANTLVWVDRQGKEEPLWADPQNYAYSVKISPDGTKVAVDANVGGNEDIWILDLNRETQTRLTLDDARDPFPWNLLFAKFVWLKGNRLGHPSQRQGVPDDKATRGKRIQSRKTGNASPTDKDHRSLKLARRA